MKSARFRFFAIAIAATVLLGAAGLYAQGMHGHHGPMSFERMIQFYTTKLDLTSAQQEQMKAIWAKEKPSLKPLMQQMRQNHEAMKTLEESGPYDETKTRALATQNSQTMVELQVAHARIKSELVSVLTPDQKTKLQQLEAEHQSQRQQHMQNKQQDGSSSD